LDLIHQQREAIALKSNRFEDSAKRLFWAENRQHAFALLLRLLLKLPVLGKCFENIFHDASTFVDMCHFATVKDHHHLDFIFMLQETDRLSDFRIDIVLAGFRSKTNFFSLGLVALTASLLTLLVLILAEIPDSTNRRIFIWSDFYKIKTGISSSIKSFVCRDDSKLSPILSDNANGRNTNLRVNASLNPIDC